MSKSQTSSNILGTFASILGIISIFIYFIGWIYRWAYFAFFQINITTLELPLESFFIAPVQVIAGNASAVLITLLGIFVAIFFIRIILLLINKINEYLLQFADNFYRKAYSNFYKKYSYKKYYRIAHELRLIAEFISHPFREEIVIVISNNAFFIFIICYVLIIHNKAIGYNIQKH